MVVAQCPAAGQGVGQIGRRLHLVAILVACHSRKAHGGRCVVYIVGELRQGLGCIAAHRGRLGVGDGGRVITDGGRALAEDEAIFHACSHIGRLVCGVPVVLVPRCNAFRSLGVERLLVGKANGADGDTRLACHVLAVVQERAVEVGEVCPVATVRPVHGYNDHGIGVGAMLAYVFNPLPDIVAERLGVGSWQRALLLENDVRPCLAAY